MNNLAVIPARGGSKRIPRKNIKDFLGKPVIAYSIEAALKTELFSEIMVTTDDEEIAEIAQKYGAKVPFKRSAKNSDDHATTADVLYEVIMQYNSLGKTFKYACCLYPTAPLIQVNKLKEAYTLLQSKNADAVIPVVPFSFPIQRALQIEDNKLSIVEPQFFAARSQDLPKRYHDSGAFYWFNIENFLDKKQIFTDKTYAIELSDLEVQDIDNLSDWKLAELKYQLLNLNIME